MRGLVYPLMLPHIQTGHQENKEYIKYWHGVRHDQFGYLLPYFLNLFWPKPLPPSNIRSTQNIEWQRSREYLRQDETQD